MLPITKKNNSAAVSGGGFVLILLLLLVLLLAITSDHGGVVRAYNPYKYGAIGWQVRKSLTFPGST
jgi:hypothetical protein